MHLRPNEAIAATYHHHYFPFVLTVVKILAASVPFYFLLFAIETSLSSLQFSITFFCITFLFVLVFLYSSFIYWMYRLIITNFRVVFINWKLLNVSEEHETELKDIQDIRIAEKGVLSFIPFLNYGSLSILTAAAKVSVYFTQAPAPDRIKRFIFSVK